LLRRYTEVHTAYLDALRGALDLPRINLLGLVVRAIDVKKDVVSEKLRLFDLVDRA